jgi:hypothetical protein
MDHSVDLLGRELVPLARQKLREPAVNRQIMEASYG